MRTIFVNSHSEKNREVFDISKANHQSYCERHGYAILNDIAPYSPRHNTNLIISLLGYFDLVVTWGSDILITDMNRRIETMVTGPVSIWADHDGVLNNDLTIFTGDRETSDILKACDDLSNSTSINSQTAMCRLYKSGEFPGITISPDLQRSAPTLNTWCNPKFLWKPGDFSIHFNELHVVPNNRKKVEHMKHFLSQQPKELGL